MSKDAAFYILTNEGSYGRKYYLLTSEGKILLLSAKLIVEETERIRKIPSLFDSQKNLSISGTWSSLLMCSFMQFRNEYPIERIQDDFKETSFQQAVRDVMDQNYRISIVSCIDSHREHHKIELKKYHIGMRPLAANIPSVAVVSKDHALGRFRTVTTEQLKKYPLVAYDIQNSDDWLGEFDLGAADDVLNIFDRGGLIDAIRHNYVAIIPKDPELERVLSDSVTLQISDGPKSSIYLLSHDAYTMNPRERHFVSVFSARLRDAYPNSMVPRLDNW